MAKKCESSYEYEIKIKNYETTIEDYKKICNELKTNLEKQKINMITL